MLDGQTSQTEKSDSPGSREVAFSVDCSRGFVEWLDSKSLSLGVTTYQVGKVILFGVDRQADTTPKLWSFNRNIGRCLGMATDDRGFWVTSDTQLIRFDNLLVDGQIGSQQTDALYAPRFSYFTGDLDAHDLAIQGDGDLLFANTLFNCVARPSRSHSFEPVWRPDFISRLAAEDRCHLNGVAIRDGKLRYVTLISQTDVFDGWREHRDKGGVVIDVQTGETICSGLSMPHSPRWHAGRLWLNNSGTGEFGYVDEEKKCFVPVTFCPGYLRGLSFIDDTTAVVGLSLPRDNKTFSGLALDDRLKEAGVSARCGLYFVDLASGDVIHSMVFHGLVTELYDVVTFPGIKKPSMIGPNTPDIKRTLSVPPESSHA
ncbi:TIGR03032 family protein [Algimonas arctica]|uniref:TIGR03032 family protein n=1 Tax=Algimonas arctica TaxID=1479486 RepID=A0A8J3CVB5_9PROT|nr:TIGR03032 family protein [Algimonas arctica]GHB05392.1 TIGR03032 family protein [Algimonas arctica]